MLKADGDEDKDNGAEKSQDQTTSHGCQRRSPASASRARRCSPASASRRGRSRRRGAWGLNGRLGRVAKGHQRRLGRLVLDRSHANLVMVQVVHDVHGPQERVAKSTLPFLRVLAHSDTQPAVGLSVPGGRFAGRCVCIRNRQLRERDRDVDGLGSIRTPEDEVQRSRVLLSQVTVDFVSFVAFLVFFADGLYEDLESCLGDMKE